MKRAAVGVAVALTALALASPAAGQKKADYGDAPDGGGWSFPSRKSSDGARHSRAGRVLLGTGASREKNSRQVDLDSLDDGFDPQLAPCAKSRVIFLVDASRVPKELRRAGHRLYLNAWFDWTRDGDWRDRASCEDQRVPEWRLKNLRLNMASFAKRPVQAIAVDVLAGPDISALWTRASVTLDQRFKRPARGLFADGETEDSLFRSVAGPAPAPGPGPYPPPEPDPPPPPDPDPKDPRGIHPICVNSFSSLLANNMFLFHGDESDFQLLIWPPGRQAKFDVFVPPKVAEKLSITRSGDLLTVRSLKDDEPPRTEKFKIKVIATAGQLAVAFHCNIKVWHSEFTLVDESGDPVPEQEFVPPPPGPPPSDPTGARRNVYARVYYACPKTDTEPARDGELNGSSYRVENPAPGKSRMFSLGDFQLPCANGSATGYRLGNAPDGNLWAPDARLFQPNTTYELMPAGSNPVHVDIALTNQSSR